MIRLGSTLALAFGILAAMASAAQADESDARRKRVEKSLQMAIVPDDNPGYTLEDRMQAHDAPGITVAVIEDFELDWARAYGKADTTTGRKLTTHTRHNVGSVSKTVCALTAMRLVEAGKLGLDEPINRYLSGRYPRFIGGQRAPGKLTKSRPRSWTEKELARSLAGTSWVPTMCSRLPATAPE